MPKGKSIYETYFEPGASTGRYSGSLQKVADVWSDIDFSREKSAWETERRERRLDTILAATELGATIGGSMVGFEEGSTAISAKTGVDEPLKIGRGGEEWETLSGFQKLWQSPRFKFGDDIIMSKSEIRKYGRDVKEFGKYGVDLPLDVYQGKSMHAEYRQGYVRPEEDWYLGKHAKKLAQTIVPGGEVGYKDLYSSVGKKASDVVKTKESGDDIQLDPTGEPITKEPPLESSSIIQPKYKYEEGDKNIAGSESWFKTVLERFKTMGKTPELPGSFKKYNPQLKSLAGEMGWSSEKGWQ